MSMICSVDVSPGKELLMVSFSTAGWEEQVNLGLCSLYPSNTTVCSAILLGEVQVLILSIV